MPFVFSPRHNLTVECTTDRCSRFPCRHGGKCIASDEGTAICLCPLGFGGDLCEMRLDLQVRALFYVSILHSITF